jgi:hypothetical protein
MKLLKSQNISYDIYSNRKELEKNIFTENQSDSGEKTKNI